MKNVTVSTRLIAGFGLLTALLLAVAAIGFYGLSQLNGRLDDIARVNNAETKLANQLRTSIQDRAIAVRNLALLSDAQDMAKEAERISKQEQIYADAYQKLSQLFTDEPGTTEREKALLAQIRRDEAAALPPLRKAAQLSLANDREGATRELLQNARTPQRTWLARAVELADFEDQLNDQAQRDAVSLYSSVRVLIAAIVAASLLVAAVAAVLITRSILRQLGGEPGLAQSVAAEIANGNLMVDLHLKPGDSTSLMASLEAMRARLTSIVHGIKTSAESISVAANRVQTEPAAAVKRQVSVAPKQAKRRPEPARLPARVAAPAAAAAGAGSGEWATF
ncbi:MCP four helix bundle domain-containing protein [Burkholderia glumae]|nr:MCP four helix bundle domain-containing protein [Burkholderia glumae]MCM2495884.1 MCP four helix bundle domain-containing protein [Burkholderia glumae]